MASDKRLRRLRGLWCWVGRGGAFLVDHPPAWIDLTNRFWTSILPDVLALLSVRGAFQLAHLLRRTVETLQSHAAYQDRFRQMVEFYDQRYAFRDAIDGDQLNGWTRTAHGELTLSYYLVSAITMMREIIMARAARASMRRTEHRRLGVFRDWIESTREHLAAYGVQCEERHRGMLRRTRDGNLHASVVHCTVVRHAPRYQRARHWCWHYGHALIDACRLTPGIGEAEAFMVVYVPASGARVSACRLSRLLPGTAWDKSGSHSWPHRDGDTGALEPWVARRVSLDSALKRCTGMK